MPVKIKKKPLKKRSEKDSLRKEQKGRIIMIIFLLITILFGIWIGVSFAK